MQHIQVSISMLSTPCLHTRFQYIQSGWLLYKDLEIQTVKQYSVPDMSVIEMTKEKGLLYQLVPKYDYTLTSPGGRPRRVTVV